MPPEEMLEKTNPKKSPFAILRNYVIEKVLIKETRKRRFYIKPSEKRALDKLLPSYKEVMPIA